MRLLSICNISAGSDRKCGYADKLLFEIFHTCHSNFHTFESILKTMALFSAASLRVKNVFIIPFQLYCEFEYL